MKIVTSWDDGKHTDLWLADLLRKYQLPAIFYIPTCCELSNDEIKELANDFEIGGHTVSHPPDMKMLDTDEIYFQVSDNRKELQDITGQKIESFCYPRGRYDDRVIEQVKKAGFTNARTTEVLNTLPVVNPFKTPTTIHVYQRAEYLGNDWLYEARQWFKLASENPEGIFHLWGHSQEVLKFGLEKELETLFQEINAYIYPKQ